MTYQTKKRNGISIFVPKLVSFYGIDGIKKTCDICGKDFMKKPNRKFHNCKKYYCEQCGKCLSTKSDLKRHVKIVHEKRKEFTCDICEKSFGHRPHLQRHIKSVHEGKKDVKCQKCRKNFRDIPTKNRHFKEVHEGIKRAIRCKKCDKKTRKSSKNVKKSSH